MPRRKVSEMVRYLRHLVDPEITDGLSDAELLQRYVRGRDEAAFELLLWRHGVLVFNVCRRVLSREQDAEDAFQAAFLAFVRKAHAIAHGGSVSSWLYTVAYRIALEMREKARKTETREKSGGEAVAVQSSACDSVWSDLRPILDEELNRLPERLRRPIVLCHLEGKSNEEAARELGCRLGTIYSRLSRGRELLRKRLLQRGVTMSVAVITAALAEHAAEAAPAIPVMRTAVRAARTFAGLPSGGPISPRATALAEGALRAMFVTKLKLAALAVFVVGLLSVGGVLTHALTAAPQQEEKAEKPAPRREEVRKPDAKPIAVKVVKPMPGGLVRSVRVPAHVIASQQQRIVPLISGTVKEVGVDIGDQVKKGQVLMALDAPLLSKEVVQAETALEMAKAQVDEALSTVVIAEAELESAEMIRKRLEHVESGSVSIIKLTTAQGDVKIKQGKLAHAKASLKAAKANVQASQVAMDKARIRVELTRMTAAFDGVVTRRTIDPGNFVQPSDSRLLTPLLTLQRIDQVRVVVQAPSHAAPSIARGDAVDLDLYGLPGVRISGQKIARVSPILDGSEQSMTVEIDVPNAEKRLTPGMQGQVTIHCRKRQTEAMVVPSFCVTGANRKDVHSNYVYVVRDGKAHRILVDVSWDDEKNTEIVKGIKASDLVITNHQGVDEGTPVEVKKEP